MTKQPEHAHGVCLLGARSVSWSALMPLTLVDQ